MVRTAGKQLVFGFLLAMVVSGCSLFGGDDDHETADGGVGQPCSSNSDCGDAFVCAGGACQFEGSVGLGGDCWANRDCGTDLFCNPSGVCAPAGSGGVGDPCGSGAECAADLVCDLYGFSGTCREAGTGDLGQPCEASTDCIAGLVCAADGTCKPPEEAYPPFTGVECGEAETPFRVYFEVPRQGDSPDDFFRLPFPNDARVSAAGELDMDDFPRPGPGPLGFDLVDLYVDALVADFDGFSSTAMVTFRFSDHINFDSIGANGSNLHYIDITPDAATYGADRWRAYSFNNGRGLYVCQDALVVSHHPDEPLLPQHIYAVYLTTGVRSESDETPTQDADFAAVLAATRPTGDDDLANAWDKYQPFRDYLAGESIDPATIAGAAVFTVQDTTGPAIALASAVETTAAPALTDLTLCDDGVTSPCDDGATRVCGSANDDYYEIHGRYSVPIYQQGTTPYATPADGGRIEFVGGVPQQVDTTPVCMVLTIPKNATKPAGGWPLVIYAHGTGGSFTSAISNGVADELATASQPMAMMSFDGVVHGERRNDNSRDEDSLMFNLVNPVAARDNGLQGAVDVLQAFRLADLAGFDVTGVGTIDFDAGNVYFFGHSQGSNVGVPAAAVSSRPRGAIFSGAGAYLTYGILNKTSPVDSKAGLSFLLGEEVSAAHPVMTIWQTYFDRSDTVNFAPLVLERPPSGVTPKHVFQSWGMGDTFSPRPTLNTMARALGVPVAEPVFEAIDRVSQISRPVTLNKTTPDGPRTAALFQYEPSGYDGHFVATRNSDAVADWLAFLTSAITGDPAVP